MTANTYWLRYYLDQGAGGYDYLDNVSGNTFIGQAYFQGSYRPSPKWTFNAGLHALFFTLNNTYSIEPRFAVQFQPTKTTTLTAAYTWHGKVLPIGTYLLQLPDGNGNITQPNRDLEIAKLQHAIVGFQQVLGRGFRLNLEGYFQHGYDQPVGTEFQSGYWLFNQRDNYGTRAMVSEGRLRNYGVNLTAEKAFSRSFFILATGSLFWAQYKSLGDTEWRSTRVDKRWGTSLMGGYEWAFKKGGALQLGLKCFISGGLRYTPADEAASRAAGILVEDTERYFEAVTNTYFRLDGRVAYRKNLAKWSYTISLDVQNITNARNVRFLLYDRQTAEFEPRLQSGLLPVISFQADF